jgi:filamentous hemagglutinin
VLDYMAHPCGNPQIKCAIMFPPSLSAEAGALEAELGGLAEGAASPIVEGGGLAAHEAAGGHLLARHVGLDAAALDVRLATNLRLRMASSFASRAEAEAAASSVLGQNSAAVSAWLRSGAVGRLTLDGGFSGGTVRLLGGYSVEGTAARLVLQGDGASSYFILTGYPTP